MWADLQEGSPARFQLGAKDGLQPHGLSEVAVPVGGGEVGALDRLAADGGDRGDLGLLGGYRGEGGFELVFHGLDLGGVGGVVDRYLPGRDACSLEALLQLSGDLVSIEAGAVHGDLRHRPASVGDQAGRVLE